MTRSEELMAVADALDRICVDCDVALRGQPDSERLWSRTVLRWKALGDFRANVAKPLEEILAGAPA